ncbi:MAG: hypothetical protein [Olavius algarvensis Gamma 1 endosymbiont]|nr:MAG: hypothetical protein [Olavius algarvensis Gamma 1 endosymbiont]
MGLKCDQTIVLTGTHTPCYYPEKLRRNLRIKAFFGTSENRVVPLDNFMIYKDIIRLDRPD